MPRPSPDFFLESALAIYALAWLAVACWLILRRTWVAIVAVALFLIALLPATGWGFLDYQIAHQRQNPVAVVAVNGVTFRRGNGPAYPPHPHLPLVNRGMEARLLHERGGWLQVQFPSGDIGWLPRAAVIK
jgi:hypothetical protein